MRRYIAVLGLVCWGPILPAQRSRVAHSGEIRLLVRGDDMGAAHGINVGALQAYKEGILTATNVIVPGPWFPEAVRMLNENPGLDAGLHLALTSEWDGIKWRPLTAAPTLVDASGYFFPLVSPAAGFAKHSSIAEAKPNLTEVEKELSAQIELAKRLIPRVDYFTCHMGFKNLPELGAIVERLSHKYDLPAEPIKRICAGCVVCVGCADASPFQVYEKSDSGAVRAKKLAAKLESLTPGTWIFYDHPATNTPEIQALGHTPTPDVVSRRGGFFYTNVAGDRWAVVEALTSPLVKEVVKRRGIKLIGHRELSEGMRQQSGKPGE